MTTHSMFDGKLQVYQRANSRVWQCAARVGGKRYRSSTGEENFSSAKIAAEEWYLGLRGQLAAGIIEPKLKERTFADAAKEYLREIKVLAISTRSPKYVEGLEIRLNAHILPYFGKMPLTSINRGVVQSYRVKRAEDTIAKTFVPAKPATDDEPAQPEIAGRPPARSTMLHEIVHIRQVLKFAEGKGWIPFVPSLSTPYMTQGKKGRRAWFSEEEYKKLYTATSERAKDGTRPGWKSHYEDLHDFVLFMANTGLRPDEALRLEMRDVKIEDDYATRETILVIDVRGKTGVGYCKSTHRAVHPFTRLKQRRLHELRLEAIGFEKLQKTYPHLNKAEIEKRFQEQIDSVDEAEILKKLPFLRVFPTFNRDAFNKILEEQNLKFDRDGKRRTAYSLRHTYISTRLMEGASIHMIANNCRTSVQMIEEHYASHIKDRLDAAAINVMRPKRQRDAAKQKKTTGTDNHTQL
ncbi:MAG: site-specific integrase [Asticcacaulis sp.]|uniref:tyrosine-type recombinase/integrase n=1 Tax=Asticcacaulis sp. TaxID=1872648 RepID=UPI0039E6C9EE